MKIVVNLDVMMARRKMSLGELAQKVDITMANPVHPEEQQGEGYPLFHSGGHLCRLDCQPGDILEFVPEEGDR